MCLVRLANIFRIVALVSPLPTTLYSKVLRSDPLSMAGLGCFISTAVSENLPDKSKTEQQSPHHRKRKEASVKTSEDTNPIQ
jgi:hypothetical protein